MSHVTKLPVTVLLAVKNEQLNIGRCLAALEPATRVIVVDSHSTDRTTAIAASMGAEVVQFTHNGGYPKKRQWVLDHIAIRTPWILLLDADEVVPPELWEEIAERTAADSPYQAFLITKEFHFLGRRFRFGGFSFAAVLLVRTGKGRFEQLPDKEFACHTLDMEVHERIIVDGLVGRLHSPLLHDDFKGLQAYLDRHNRYSTWEAGLRYSYFTSGQYGATTIRPRLFGNTQERRRFLKNIAIRLPFEAWLWFAYHYVFRLGFLEGRRGLIASQIRAAYISQIRAKVFELQDKARPAPQRCSLLDSAEAFATANVEEY